MTPLCATPPPDLPGVGPHEGDTVPRAAAPGAEAQVNTLNTWLRVATGWGAL